MGTREAVDVVDLERSPLGAAVSSVVDEGAATAVALVDGTLHRVRHVARFGFYVGCRWAALLAADCEAFLPNLCDEHFERSAEDGREVAVRHAVPQEILGLANLVPELPRDSELQLVRGLGHRNDWTSRRRLRFWSCLDERE